MKKRTTKLGSVALMAAALGVTAVQADTLTTWNLVDDYQDAAEVLTYSATNSTFGDDANISLTQTFSVDSAFSAQRISLPYENDTRTASDFSMTLRLFAVDDVLATDLVDPGTGSDLWSATFTFPFMADNARAMAQIDLSTSVFLAASVGTSGYALHITESSDGDFNPGWEWLRPTTDVYAGGNQYEDGLEKNGGARDLSLSITSIPEPGTLSLLSATAIAALMIRRARRR